MEKGCSCCRRTLSHASAFPRTGAHCSAWSCPRHRPFRASAGLRSPAALGAMARRMPASAASGDVVRAEEHHSSQRRPRGSYLKWRTMREGRSKPLLAEAMWRATPSHAACSCRTTRELRTGSVGGAALPG